MGEYNLIKPVPWRVSQNFSGAFPAERPGWLRTDVYPHRGRRTPFAGGKFRMDLHLGIDYPGPVGVNVVAMNTGPIVRQGVDWDSGGAWFVQQRIHRSDRFDLYMLYYHLRANSLKHPNGKVVEQGRALAQNGNTGWSSGPHVHIEMIRLPRGTSASSWYSGLRLDPQPFINGDVKLNEVD